MGTCSLCGKTSVTVSSSIGVCVDCLREFEEEALEVATVSYTHLTLPTTERV